MIKKKLFLLFALCSLLFASCKFNPNLQGRGTDFMQGVWQEEHVLYQDKLLQYTQHNFTFTCDSFYLTMNTVAKVNTYADSCFNNGKWTEYAKGTYMIKKDTLLINGTYTKSNFKQKISGCHKIGVYSPVFIIKKYNADSLYLENFQKRLPLTLVLKQKITCIPKPIR